MNTTSTKVATVEVKHVSKSYETPSSTIEVLNDISFSLSAGNSLAILGPSGTGKSTLLHLLGTLDRPDSGSIQIDGVDPFDLDELALSKFRNAKIGFIFQDHHLLPHLNVIENVLVPSLAQGKPSRERMDRAEALLESVGLEKPTHSSTESSIRR